MIKSSGGDMIPRQHIFYLLQACSYLYDIPASKALDQYIRTLLVLLQGEVENGFFIEAGADDFVGGSNRFRILPKQWIILIVIPCDEQASITDLMKIWLETSFSSVWCLRGHMGGQVSWLNPIPPSSSRWPTLKRWCSYNLFGWRAKLGLSDLPLKDKNNKSKCIFSFLGFACSEEGLECCHLPGHCNKVKCWKSMLVQRRRGGERDCFHSPEQPSCWNSIAGRTSVGSPWKWPRERWLALYRTVGREMVPWRQLLWYF